MPIGVFKPPGIVNSAAYSTSARHLARNAGAGAYYSSTEGLWTGSYTQGTFVMCIYPLFGNNTGTGYSLVSTAVNGNISSWGYPGDPTIGLTFGAKNTANSTLTLQKNSGTVLPLNQWSGVGWAFNGSTAKVVVNGSPIALDVQQWSGQTMRPQNDFGNVYFGSGGSYTLRCYICHIWARPVYHDLGDSTNWAKFFTGAGKNIPISLGADGSIPFGVQPTTFAPDGNLAANVGSLADWSHTGGTVAVAPISPTG